MTLAPKSSSKKRREGGTVWDSEVGAICPACDQPKDGCTCGSTEDVPQGDGIVRVELDRKGRNGKVVTVLRGIPLAANELKELATRLKQRCGTGGKSGKGVIEIQGDQRDALIEELEARGYAVRRVGG